MKINQLTESQPDPDFFQDDNNTKKTTQKIEKNQNLMVIQKLKQEIFYPALPIDAINLLILKRNSFVLGIFSFLFQNVNPIQSDRKFNSETDKIYVKML